MEKQATAVTAATDQPSSDQPPPSEPKSSLLKANLSICNLELRTPDEDIEFSACEAIVGKGWLHAAEVGEALLRIQAKRLYKNEYRSFEVYCRERWGFGRTQKREFISAAEIHKNFAMIPGLIMPQCGAQVRPLIGLPADLAQTAWLNALSWCRPDGYVPAKVVKRAVRQLLKTEQPALAAAPSRNKQQRYRIRQSARTGFQELLALLLGTTEREVLIAKVQELERLLEPLLNPGKNRR